MAQSYQHEAIVTSMTILAKAPWSRPCLGGVKKINKKVYFQLDLFPVISLQTGSCSGRALWAALGQAAEGC